MTFFIYSNLFSDNHMIWGYSSAWLVNFEWFQFDMKVMNGKRYSNSIDQTEHFSFSSLLTGAFEEQ